MTDLATAIDTLRHERARHLRIAEQIEIALGALDGTTSDNIVFGPTNEEAKPEIPVLVPEVDIGTATYPCPECGKPAKSPAGLAHHRRSHEKAKSRDKTSPAAMSPTAERTAPAGSASIPCPECNKPFGSNQAIGVHRRRAHNITGAFGRNTPTTDRPVESIEARVAAPPPESQPRPVTTLPAPEAASGRTCDADGCTAILSRFNRGDLCGVHTRAAM